MEINSRQILKFLHILSWIIFIGLCVEGGTIICSALYILFKSPSSIEHLWIGRNFSGLYQYDQGHFLAVTVLMTIVTVLKAIMFYLIIKLLHGNKLDMSQPFSKEVGKFIFGVSYLALAIGLFSNWGMNYVEWMVAQGAQLPFSQHPDMDGGDVWLFMAVVVFVIAHIFKRGIEIQAENELTV